MPLTKNEDCGKNADGSINYDYCQYCFKDGHFTQEMTMDQMIKHCAQFVDELNKNSEQKITREEFIQRMHAKALAKVSSPYAVEKYCIIMYIIRT